MQQYKSNKKYGPELSTIAMASSILLLSGCFHDNDDVDDITASDYYAVMTTHTSAYDAGNVSIISLTDFSANNKVFESNSDTVMSTFGENYYHIDRRLGNVSKFHINSPSTPVSQHSTQDNTNDITSNPHQLVMKNESMGYLIRYNSAKIWIVDPSAKNGETYKMGEIDISSYADGDGFSEATDGLLIDNKLYVLIQNLDQNNGYLPGIAYVAIFDTADNNKEIETNTDESTPKGIELSVSNPIAMDYLSTNNTLYIACAGASPSFVANYTGGLEAVNLTDNSTKLIIDDGTVDNAPYGQFFNVAILNSGRGYFMGYRFGDNAVYSFNPTTGDVDDTAIYQNDSISDIEIGPLGNLWIGNNSSGGTDGGVTLIDTVDNTISQDLIATGDLIPSDIEFVSISQSN